ncbi:MAG TPA: hypothetical protein VFA04_21560 [Bryobacteraceae bacterium]|nr:hypothetical protein [Bryobacteraceae bacterium]
MELSDVYLGLGERCFTDLVRSISIGRLKTFQLYDRMKVRLHLPKLNSENLRKSAPRFWERVQNHDEEFATEIAQAVLISHLDMIAAALNILGIPNEDGFFSKDLDPAPYLTEGWQQRVLDGLRDKFPEALLVFYINHLGWELKRLDQPYVPATPAAAQ